MITNPHKLKTAREKMEESHREAKQAALVWLIVFGLVLWLLTGCGTVKQEPVEARIASYDANVQDSGIIRSVPDGFLVTSHFHNRYLALVKTYGGRFTPPLTGDVLHQIDDAGRGAWLIDREHMVKFLTMNQWERMARMP